MITIGVTTPSVLTSALFTAYGGTVGSATAGQLTAAFCIAEQQAQRELVTYLVPTTVSGTYHLAAFGQPMMLEATHLISVDSVVLMCEDTSCDCTIYEYTECAHIKNLRQSIIELREGCDIVCQNCCGCCGSPLMWYLTWTAGLETGLAESTPTILLALAVAAKIALNQILDPGASEGGPGDPGVTDWGSFSYRESRTPLRTTAFGSSALANYAANLLKPWKVRRPMKPRW